MKITSNNYVCPTQFKSRFLEVLNQPANLKKPLERMTIGDCRFLQEYIQSLKFRTGITQSEINEILSKNGNKFIEACADFFKQKLGFSDNTVPSIITINGTIGDAPAGYRSDLNAIYLTDEYDTMSKTQVFGLLRHEFQHASQNHNILRTEDLGEEAVKHYAETSFDCQKMILLDYAENYSVKELLAQGMINDWVAQIVSSLKIAQGKKDQLAIDNILTNFKETVLNTLNDFKDTIIKERGLIRAGSKQAEIAKQHFDEFKKIDYYDTNGKIDIGKHSTKTIELEAERTQIMAEAEISNSCYLTILKNNLKELSSDKAVIETINKEFERSQKG